MKATLYYLLRTTRIILLTWVFMLRFAVSWILGSRARPRLLRQYLQTAGAGFVKLGQVLAMRYDLLPAEYCQELSRLLDRLPASPSSAIVANIELELGKPLHELFREFEPVPLSSASVAQVHAASTLEGLKVVVKVKHPGIGLRYRVDLANLRIFARCCDFFGVTRNIDLRAVVREFTRLAEEELDFRHEARNIHVLHQLMQDDDIDHCAPAVFMELCGPSVITMERLEGLWMTDFLAALENKDTARVEAWVANGISAERTSRLVFRSMLEQCFTYRTFHADPHAGNLVVLQGGTLGYVDFGMVGWLDEKLWLQQRKLNEALASEKIHLAYEAVLDMLEPLKKKDLSSFEMEVKTLFKEWLFATKTPGASIQERSSGALFVRLFEVCRQEGLSMSLGSLRLIRALMVSDMICLRLNPSLPRLHELKAYFDEQLEKEFYRRCTAQFSERTFFSLALGWIGAIQAAPNVLEWLYERLPRFGREYEEKASPFEQATGLVLSYLQAITLLLALAVLLGRTVVLRAFLGSAWAEWILSLGWYWWPIAAGGVALGAMLGAIRNKFR